MRAILAGLALIASLAACSPSDLPPDATLIAGTNVSDSFDRGIPGGSRHIRFLGGDGSSLEQAILIAGARGEYDGVQSEYDWLATHRPGWRPVYQYLLEKRPRLYDMLEISKGGQTAQVYFDITDYFGK